MVAAVGSVRMFRYRRRTFLMTPLLIFVGIAYLRSRRLPSLATSWLRLCSPCAIYVLAQLAPSMRRWRWCCSARHRRHRASALDLPPVTPLHSPRPARPDDCARSWCRAAIDRRRRCVSFVKGCALSAGVRRGVRCGPFLGGYDATARQAKVGCIGCR